MPFGTSRRTSIVRYELQPPRIVNFALMPHIRCTNSVTSPRRGTSNELRANLDAPSAASSNEQGQCRLIPERICTAFGHFPDRLQPRLPQFCPLRHLKRPKLQMLASHPNGENCTPQRRMPSHTCESSNFKRKLERSISDPRRTHASWQFVGMHGHAPDSHTDALNWLTAEVDCRCCSK